MSDFDNLPDKKYTPTNMLSKQGVTAVGGIVGGVGLMILSALPSIFGIVAGGVVGIVGIGALLSKDPADRKPGIIITAAGALSILAKVGVVRPFAGTLLSIGAIGLLALGIWNGIKFLKGLKNRS
ncbi:MAG: hypothetical protein LBT11_03840 [Treponema sp.]|jgi:hypothetical protein|nr:hypothetical protein [Treponema sp.]